MEILALLQVLAPYIVTFVSAGLAIYKHFRAGEVTQGALVLQKQLELAITQVEMMPDSDAKAQLKKRIETVSMAADVGVATYNVVQDVVAYYRSKDMLKDGATLADLNRIGQAVADRNKKLKAAPVAPPKPEVTP